MATVSVTQVPADPSISPELRRFLDDLARRKSYTTLSADSFVVGSPTGANLGSGTINAEQVYEDDKRVFTQGGNATGGVTFTPHDLGTVSTGTVTLDPLNGLKQKITVNGGITIAAPSSDGDIELIWTNGASAGAVTFSGFTKQWLGDTPDTTSGHKFVAFIYVIGGTSAYVIKAFQ